MAVYLVSMRKAVLRMHNVVPVSFPTQLHVHLLTIDTVYACERFVDWCACLLRKETYYMKSTLALHPHMKGCSFVFKHYSPTIYCFIVTAKTRSEYMFVVTWKYSSDCLLKLSFQYEDDSSDTVLTLLATRRRWHQSSRYQCPQDTSQ